MKGRGKAGYAAKKKKILKIAGFLAQPRESSIFGVERGIPH